MAGQIEAWHRYERQAVDEVLPEWSEVNGFTLVRQFSDQA
jgi:hypothetical protein